MSLNVSEQTEAQIAEQARREGVTVEALLKRLIDEHAANVSAARPLHRRDIYNDVR